MYLDGFRSDALSISDQASLNLLASFKVHNYFIIICRPFAFEMRGRCQCQRYGQGIGRLVCMAPKSRRKPSQQVIYFCPLHLPPCHLFYFFVSLCSAFKKTNFRVHFFNIIFLYAELLVLCVLRWVQSV